MTLFVENHGTSLYTLFYPNPGKETVILLHGGPGVPDGMSPIAVWLADHYQIIQFHQRGTAKSPCRDNRFTMESYISDIESIAEYFNIEKFHLFGHSWGGVYAQIYTHRHPKRLLSIFLCSSGGGTGRHWRQTMIDIAAYNKTRSTTSEWLQLCFHSILGLFGSTYSYRQQFRQLAINFNKGFRTPSRVPFQVEAVRARPIIPTMVAILRHPVLPVVINPSYKVTIAYGEHDSIAKSRSYVKARYPDARYVIIPASGHFPWLHNETDFRVCFREHFVNVPQDR